MKEAEIRPARLLERYLALSRDDVKEMAADRRHWRDCACPGCGAGKSTPAFEKHGFSYVECRDCRSLFVSPRPSAGALDRFYREGRSSRFWSQEFFPAVAEARREKIVRPRVRRVLEHAHAAELGERPMFVDVGAGAGLFLEEVRAALASAELAAVEPGEDLAGQARARGLRVVRRPAELCDELEGEGDVVTSFEVIEHVHDPLAFVRSLARLARPGGLLLVTGLGGDGFDVQVLWQESKAVSPPHHLNFISVEGLCALFERAGLTGVEVETPGELDVELVRQGLIDGAGVHRFFELLLARRGAEVGEEFQRFLQRARLSSHTWIWARKGLGLNRRTAL